MGTAGHASPDRMDRRWWASMLWVGSVGLSCASGGTGAGDVQTSVAPSSAVTDTGQGAGLADLGPSYEAPKVIPRWTAEEVAGELSEHVTSAVPNLAQLVDTYLWMMQSGDAHCPGSSTQLTGVDPELGCTAESGFWYYGVASYIETEQESGTEWVLSGDFELRTPEGLSLACGGHVGLEWSGGEEDGHHTMGTLLGTWVWQGADDAMADAVSASIVVGRSESPDLDVDAQLWVEGGLSTQDGSWTFEDFSIHAGCDGQPVGAVHVFDAVAGHWYTLTLEDDCSGCGEVSFSDTSMGRVCPDWTGMAHQVAVALAAP